MSNKIELPKERVIHFNQQVEQGSIGNVVRQILEINQADRALEKNAELAGFKYVAPPIKLYINSYGGSVYQARGLTDVMNSSVTPIHTIAVGAAMSCGFFILVHGHKRFMYPNAGVMYHQISSFAWGELKKMEEDMKQSKRMYKMFRDAIMERTSLTKKQLKNIYKSKKDWHLTAEECLAFNVVDEIIEPIKR